MKLTVRLIGVLIYALSPPLTAFAAPGLAIMAPLQTTLDEHLQRNVDFWIKIYTQYTNQQGVIHDARSVDKIYEVLNSKGHDAKVAKKKWREVLLSLHRKWVKNPGRGMPDNLTEDERHAFHLFEDSNEPDKFLKATQRKRLRFQLGQKEAFLDGLRQSGRFLPFMEDVFRKEGLPVELTRLPFVESSFNLKARSKVGASGIWQFMQSTGRLFLTINESVDERNDPLRATEAAAKLLKLNYDSLRSWPLAVTAYNHGRKGLMRAVMKVGSDQLEDVVSNYRSRSFGFASSNFYPELLAAVEIERNPERYFGKIAKEKPELFIELKLPDSIRAPILCRFLKLDRKRIRELNPGLTDAVQDGARPIPAGYALRLPPPKDSDRDSAARLFLAGFAEIPRIYRKSPKRTQGL